MNNIIFNRGKGFTIIETLAAIAVFGLSMAAIGAAIVMIYRTQGYVMEQSMAVNEARRGVDIMAKEMRQARYGENGAYPIEKGAGKEFIFYSDVDNDGQTERVRYYLATVNSGTQIKECHSHLQCNPFYCWPPAECDVDFSGFLSGTLDSAQVRVSTEGYYGTPSRYAALRADGAVLMSNMCQSGCSECIDAWQGTQTFPVTAAAADNSIRFTITGNDKLKANCNWIDPNHSIKARFEFSFTEEIPNSGNELRRGVTEPSGNPASYPAGQEQSTIITSYVRNQLPVDDIFSYYDKNNNLITSDPSSILHNTKIVRLYMIVNVNVNRAPDDYELEQYVQIRNLKEE
ncbi:MAG: prepilin-type N-terminal cleavage/methylation domain-containing protein [Minisyncoccales bacterium]